MVAKVLSWWGSRLGASAAMAASRTPPRRGVSAAPAAPGTAPIDELRRATSRVAVRRARGPRGSVAISHLPVTEGRFDGDRLSTLFGVGGPYQGAPGPVKRRGP